MDIDILLVSIGIDEYDPDLPPAGIFTLKPWLVQNGYSTHCIDGNPIGKDFNRLKEVVDTYTFKWLGISVFSNAEVQLAANLSREYPDVIIGGTGVTSVLYEQFRMLPHPGNLVIIRGEGEHAILEVLKGNLDYPGVNGRPPEQVDNLNQFPAPDYTGYPYKTGVLTGSRGCVRNCTFCNVNAIWKKYRYVDGEILAQRMVKTMEHPTIDSIYFSDSLINGSDVEFLKMCNYLIDNGHDIPWLGQFIVKKRNEDYFWTIAAAKAHTLIIGVESFSESVRWDMDKKFTNDTLHYNISNLLDFGIPSITIQVIVGYPTETDADFEMIVPFLLKYQEYSDRLNVAVTIMNVLEYTPVASHYQLGMEFEDANDLFDRFVRYLTALKLLDYYNYADSLIQKHRIESYKKVIDYYYPDRFEELEVWAEQYKEELVNAARS